MLNRQLLKEIFHLSFVIFHLPLPIQTWLPTTAGRTGNLFKWQMRNDK
jgi:hypothetical protein